MPPRAKKQARRPPVKLTDPKHIRALAHPARLAVIEELYAGRELTATECAEIAGLTPSAMSYHMRSLERAGIVERAPSSDGRERPWRAAGGYIQVDSKSSTMSAAASAAIVSTVVSRLGEQLNAWVAQREHDEWREYGGVNSGQVWLLPHEAKEIEEQVFQLVDQYRDRSANGAPDGARRVRIAMFLFPADSGES